MKKRTAKAVRFCLSVQGKRLTFFHLFGMLFSKKTGGISNETD
jgi:hypothetical protein